MQNEEIDFLAIGDIVTDAFIRIKDAEAYCDLDKENCKLCLRFGDKVPFESVTEAKAVGNSPNAAVAAARLGLKSTLLAHIGKDVHGEECLQELKKNKVDTRYVYSHEGIPTNYHYVLWYGVERTILVKHADFPYTLPKFTTAPKMIYLSSLRNHSEEYHQEIAKYVKDNPEIKLIFQPGTFQMMLGTEVLKDIYQNTYAFFCNVEEAQRILNVKERDLNLLMDKIHSLGPKIVFITDGIAGAYASDGKQKWFMPVYPYDPFERTGAGDAFSSTVSVALLKGKSIPEALTWGPINSMSVVQYIGAQEGLLSEKKLEEYLAKAPSDYAPRPYL